MNEQQRAVVQQALEALEVVWREHKAIDGLRQLLEQPMQEPALQEIEQYRMQMAGISTAALGYWKEDDGIHPDYDTPALRDVAKLYAKYAATYTTPPAQPADHGDELTIAYLDGVHTGKQIAKREWVGLTEEEVLAELPVTTSRPATSFARAIEAKLKEKNT